jgi:hypothetical protein
MTFDIMTRSIATLDTFISRLAFVIVMPNGVMVNVVMINVMAPFSQENRFSVFGDIQSTREH